MNRIRETLDRDGASTGDPHHLRVLMTYAVLGLGVIAFTVFIPVNLLLLDNPVVARVQMLFLPVCAGGILYLRRTGDIGGASFLAAVMLGAFFVAFVHFEDGSQASFALAAIFPGTALFLLGNRRGLAVAVVFILLAALAYALNPALRAGPPPGAAVIINLSLLMMFITLQAYLYEDWRERAYAENSKLLARLETLSYTDSLTGLKNRRTMEDILEQEIDRSLRHGNALCFAIVDIDHFKDVNDSFGHAGGDSVLSELAQLFTQGIRRADKVGRWGGEEFAFICPETDLEEARALFERLRERIGGHSFSVGTRITISIGISAFRDSDSQTSLAIRADKAMYLAKQGGRDRTCTEADLSPQAERPGNGPGAAG